MKKSTSLLLGYIVIINITILSTIFGYFVFQFSTIFSTIDDVIGLLFVLIIAALLGFLAIILLSHIVLSICYLPAYFQSKGNHQYRWLGFAKIANLSVGILYLIFAMIYAVFTDIRNLVPLDGYVKLLWVLVSISMLFVGYHTNQPYSFNSKIKEQS
jgi:hypothetical protein